MALIGKIRKNSWLLVVLIGLGLGGFILMDMMSGQQSILGSQQSFIGKVGSEKIDQGEFNRTEEALRGVFGSSEPYALKQMVWDYLTDSKLVRKEADELGLGVSRDELIELQFGSNLSPVVQQRIIDPQTRQVDRNQLATIRQQIEDGSINENPGLFNYWLHQEKEVVNRRLQDKISKMAAKAVYTPTWMVEMVNKDLNGQANLAFVKVPYDNVDNADITLTDDDFESYYDEKSYLYEQDEETRKVDYVSFPVVPSGKDSANIREQMNIKVDAFASATNDSLFVEANFGTYNPSFYTEDEVSEEISTAAFVTQPGGILGPYVEGREYRLTKVIERVEMADSASSRHILISASTDAEFNTASTRIDSFKTVIENGSSSFEDLAKKFSQDPGSKDKGGLYENVTPNSFVPPYNRVLFVTGEIGELYKVKTSYGVHLIRVEDRHPNTTPRVRIATIGQPILPSEETQRAAENEVYKLVQANQNIDALREAIKDKPGASVETSPALKRNDYVVGSLGSGQASRDIIRWAFGDDISMSEPDLGDVAPKFFGYQDPVLYYNDKYVVVALNSIIPAGLPDWTDMKSEIEPYVINRKKADIIKGKMASQDLIGLASDNNVEVDTVNAITFGGTGRGALANETDVIAKAFTLNAGETSQPISGSSGVFVVKVLNKTPAPAPNPTAVKRQAEASYKSRITTGLVQALKKNAGVDDNRARFF